MSKKTLRGFQDKAVESGVALFSATRDLLDAAVCRRKGPRVMAAGVGNQKAKKPAPEREFRLADTLAFGTSVTQTALVRASGKGKLSGTETVMPGIEKTGNICGGDACITSTRVPVWALEQGRRLGFSDAELLDNYPSLTDSDLGPAWAYVKTHKAEVEKAIRENEEA